MVPEIAEGLEEVSRSSNSNAQLIQQQLKELQRRLQQQEEQQQQHQLELHRIGAHLQQYLVKINQQHQHHQYAFNFMQYVYNNQSIISGDV
ncbi:hypothetical protein BX616_004604 [Lobosporangium transversale]|nr:hypothetical protein BX616_004604 [Lobosporangium transversale]